MRSSQNFKGFVTEKKVKILYISAYFSFYKIPSLVLVSLLLNHLSLGIGIILYMRKLKFKELKQFFFQVTH